ncbi:MAG: Gfo/Idh/MocA family oxidoreductase [Acidimicrobiales bacterium]|nr:Gfo/Idh/MocA family oxidoreductase [Acidimicrobiales bacterium]
MSASPTIGFAVVGADHLHLFSIVGGLVDAGASAVAHVESGELIAGYAQWQTDSEPRSFDEVLAADDVDLIVTVGIPDERAGVAIAALEAGKAVLSAKPGVIDRRSLDRIGELVAGRSGRPFTVLFTERFENRAIGRAVAMARAGDVGRVVAVSGSGPHTLAAEHRPEWFWDPSRSGGILVDLASHQVDQFVALCGTDEPGAGIEVARSQVGNVSCPDHPEMQDVGSMTLLGPTAVGEHRVDLLSPAGLPTWGDVRLVVIGTTGTLEVRANIDPGGEGLGEHLIVVDEAGTRRVDVSGDELRWAHDLLEDLADDGERLMTQDHVLTVCDLALRAQENAGSWGSGAGR